MNCEVCSVNNVITEAVTECRCGIWVCKDHASRCDSCGEGVCSECVKVWERRNERLFLLRPLLRNDMIGLDLMYDKNYASDNQQASEFSRITGKAERTFYCYRDERSGTFVNRPGCSGSGTMNVAELKVDDEGNVVRATSRNTG